MLKKVFIQAFCKYPHGGALANYVESLAKAISYAGYKVVLITDLNEEYEESEQKHFEMFDAVYITKPSKDIEMRRHQGKCGFAKERLEAMKQEQIEKDDVVIILGIYNEYMLNKLFADRDNIGFKVICAVLELFTVNDYKSPEGFYKINHIKEEVYIQADAILLISDFIDRHYNEKGVCTYKFPPMIDYDSTKRVLKHNNRRKFIIPTGKDSFGNMLKAFGELTAQELSELEIHICSVKEVDARDVLGKAAWSKVKEHIIIHDWMRYEELEELYSKMHFLLIAREECQRTLANFPSKVPETMAYGIVPIVSDVGDYTKYYLEDGKNSIFIHGDSVDEIVNSIRKAIQLSEKEYNRYSMEAIECAKDRFDYRNWKSKIQNMMEELTVI